MKDDLYAINEKSYHWSVRLFSIFKRLLRVNIMFHHYSNQIQDGDIFLFNHFARFETFIPQYLIYKKTGSYCRSVAASEFFKADNALASYLRSVGAVPNDHPQLLQFLASEILCGRKVIIFPEGGMVKDRRVLDEPGSYSIYSRSAEERRKHHRGAAVLALALDAYKRRVAYAIESNDQQWLQQQAELLAMDSLEQFLECARKPTRIVPANITFYPIRVSDNLLRKGMELLNGGLSRRASEELLIEGNILLKNTDMDIRLSDPIEIDQYWHWLDKILLKKMFLKFNKLEDFFNLDQGAGLLGKGLAKRVAYKLERVRDKYMHEMYLDVTVNLSHLSAVVIFQLIEAGEERIAASELKKILYIAIKNLQSNPEVHLHRGLQVPEHYERLLYDDNKGFIQFLKTASESNLIEIKDGNYFFTEKLYDQHEFDEVRIENIVEVYANEVAPISAVKKSVIAAIKATREFDRQVYARLRFDDESRQHVFDTKNYQLPQHEEINRQQTATADARCYLELPEQRKPVGIVLVHGFLASPAELRPFADRLLAENYAVMGVRLKGHGTSPWDLRDCHWEDWLACVEKGYEIISAFCERTCIIGFSTGGALALRFAANKPEKLAAVVSVSVPIKFQDKKMMLVSLVHGANRLVRWVSSSEGLIPFQLNNSENPTINYRHIPLRGLFELRQLVAEVEAHLAEVSVPCLVVHGDKDPVAMSESAKIIYDKLRLPNKHLLIVNSQKHGILRENIDNTQDKILDYLRNIFCLE